MAQTLNSYRLILILFVLFTSASASLAAESCHSIFMNGDSLISTENQNKSSYPPPHLKVYYKSVGSWDTPVPFHTMNVDALLNHLVKQGTVSGQRAAFEKGVDNGLEQIILPEFATSFIIVKSADSSGLMTLKDIMGRWFTVKVEKGVWPNAVKIDFSTMKFIPDETGDLNAYSNYLRKGYTSLRIESMSAKQLGDYLTTIQLKTSTNSENSKGEKHDQYVAGVEDANTLIAELFKSNASMTVADLSRINKSANKGINPYEFEINAPMAGVLRGTSNEVVLIDGKETVVDMSRFEVAQTWKANLTLKVQRLNYFAPAKEVPQRTQDLLVKINSVNTTTKPMDVFAIYKEFIHIHPFADGNGRTGRILLNYLLLKANLPPAEKPAASLFYRTEDSFRKYVETVEQTSGKKSFKNDDKQTFQFESLKTIKDVQDIKTFTETVKATYNLSELTIDHLYGTRAYLFVAVYKGRFIQFESTHDGSLSDSLHVMINKSKQVIDAQEREAEIAGVPAPKFAVYPELLAQAKNYHQLHQEHYLKDVFEATHHKDPDQGQILKIKEQATKKYEEILSAAAKEKTDYGYIKTMMQTPQLYHQAKTVEDVADQVMTITSAAYQKRIYESMTVKASPENRQTTVDIYNAFNSNKFDEFMVKMALKALNLCRQAKECSDVQRSDIPEKYLAQSLKNEADKLGIMLETISRQAGREPGRLFVQRIRRGSLIIDDGAPGNHGLMPHALQNLFIYEQVGFAKAQKFFQELTGWTYERMFDSNNSFTPIPSTRDITQRHYWTGVIKAGNRNESSKLGSLKAEEGRYPDFIRKNGLDFVEVREIEKNMMNDGAIIKARYKGKTFEFPVDRDGVPSAEAQKLVDSIKQPAAG